MEKKISSPHKKLCKKYGVNPDLVPEIHSYESACKFLKKDAKKLPIVKGLGDTRHAKRIIADYKLSIIADALREGKDMVFGDGTYKYFARFWVEKKRSGFGLSYDGCGYWYSFTDVGVRLCFPTSDHAIFFGKHFIELHKDHHLYT